VPVFGAFKAGVTAYLAAVAILLSPVGGARGASLEPGDPVYHALRYNDDFSWLTDPAKSSDPWDKFKYVPIGDGKYGASYLGLGGELRERFESYLNPNFDLRAPGAMRICCTGCC